MPSAKIYRSAVKEIVRQAGEEEDQWVCEKSKERFRLRFSRLFEARETKLGFPFISGNLGLKRLLSYLESDQQSGRRITGDCKLGGPERSNLQVHWNVR